MLITESVLSFSFPEKKKIRQKALELEKHLEDFITLPLNIFSVPEDAPAEIPRASGNSTGGHSALTITQVAANFHTRYDNGFPEDWKLCLEYLKKKLVLLFPFISQIGESEILSFGIVIKVIFPLTEEVAADRICELILKSEALPKKLDEISFKVTFLNMEKYYVNYLIEPLRSFRMIPVSGKSNLNYLDKKPVSEAIQFTVDINDRLIANFTPDYFTELKTCLEILGISSEIIGEKLVQIHEYGNWGS